MSIHQYLSAILLAVVVSLGLVNSVHAEDETATEQIHQLVIQINSDSMDEQDHVLSNIVNLQKYYGLDNIEIEVVAYGSGIWLVTDKSNFANRVESLMMQNVVFTACGNTMDSVEAKSGARPTLLDGVEITKAGIARIIELQEQGWSYLSP
ncbi:MAG: DsrE family protein [Gammaproteobacteria bacterium]|nr:DsrE family protein [Gammaproteobacteria bacterium]MBU1724097.1 DsrE family protein [Gammaproteobacteria bacterium]MBU2006827.1 DsrE family protein [Gammaproteobacteria bacterium]